MTAIPKSLAAATRLLEQYADLESRIALVEEDRTTRIADANAWADNAAAPMIKARDDIAVAIESWWPHAAPLIAEGNKSVQLGGCMIGTRLGRATMAHSFENDGKAVEALRGSRYAKFTTRVKYEIDRTAIRKLLEVGGKTAVNLEALGFTIAPGSDRFFVERVQQAATIGR